MAAVMKIITQAQDVLIFITPTPAICFQKSVRPECKFEHTISAMNCIPHVRVVSTLSTTQQVPVCPAVT